MERKKASEYPQELLDLFDQYVHGGIDRRAFLEGAQKFAVGGLTATAIWESLRPNYAWAQQVPKDDSRLKTERATVDSPRKARQRVCHMSPQSRRWLRRCRASPMAS